MYAYIFCHIFKNVTTFNNHWNDTSEIHFWHILFTFKFLYRFYIVTNNIHVLQQIHEQQN